MESLKSKILSNERTLLALADTLDNWQNSFFGGTEGKFVRGSGIAAQEAASAAKARALRIIELGRQVISMIATFRADEQLLTQTRSDYQRTSTSQADLLLAHPGAMILGGQQSSAELSRLDAHILSARAQLRVSTDAYNAAISVFNNDPNLLWSSRVRPQYIALPDSEPARSGGVSADLQEVTRLNKDISTVAGLVSSAFSAIGEAENRSRVDTLTLTAVILATLLNDPATDAERRDLAVRTTHALIHKLQELWRMHDEDVAFQEALERGETQVDIVARAKELVPKRRELGQRVAELRNELIPLINSVLSKANRSEDPEAQSD
jgi:hypothetical protein